VKRDFDLIVYGAYGVNFCRLDAARCELRGQGPQGDLAADGLTVEFVERGLFKSACTANGHNAEFGSD
jgi:hypothetical protein